MLQKRLEYWVWQRTPRGGTYKQVATTEKERDELVRKLKTRGVIPRVVWYYRIY